MEDPKKHRERERNRIYGLGKMVLTGAFSLLAVLVIEAFVRGGIASVLQMLGIR